MAGAENSYWRRLGPRRSRTTNQDFAPNQTAGSFKLSQEVIELALNSDPLDPPLRPLWNNVHFLDVLSVKMVISSLLMLGRIIPQP